MSLWVASRRYRLAISAATLLCFIGIILFLGFSQSVLEHGSLNRFAKGVRPSPGECNSCLRILATLPKANSPEIKKSCAYVTLLAATEAHRLNTSEASMLDDTYFVATRLLGFQLMHNPETRSQYDFPFIVLHTSDVPAIWRERLHKDGATLLEVEVPDLVNGKGWLASSNPRYASVFAKLHVWNMTEYEHILFLDGDTVLLHSLDSVFEEAAVSPTESNATLAVADEIPLPAHYVLATIPEASRPHEYPPTEENGGFGRPGYFNAGFFLAKPDPIMLLHYYSIMSIKGRFDAKYPEQNLLNYAHRQDGPMPAQWIGPTWNIRWATDIDLEGGVASMHEKFWTNHYPAMNRHFARQLGRMEGFYQARDLDN